MRQEAYLRNQQILTKFTSADSDNVKVLYAPGLLSSSDNIQGLRWSGFVTSLRIVIEIMSEQEVELPDLDVTSTPTERLAAVREMEWGNPRKQIQLLIKTATMPWTKVAYLSLLNRRPYYALNLMPYLTDNTEFEVAADTQIGARIEDAGYGLLEAFDELTIHGTVREECIAIPTDSPVVTVSSLGGANLTTASQIVLPANAQRRMATLVNTSSTQPAYLAFGPLAVRNQGITLMPGGGSYEVNLSNPYRGPISAVADGPARLTWLEGV